MTFDLEELKESLTKEEIINILLDVEPNLKFLEIPKGLLLPTVCHNLDPGTASLKLYYYENTKLFSCYTECNDSFDIYELLKKMFLLRDKPADFSIILALILKYKDSYENFLKDGNKETAYQSDLIKFKKKKQNFIYPVINENILNFFQDYYYKGWLDEGITKESMDVFRIKFSVNSNQVIIPHFNKNGDLIGIRGRNLSEVDINNIGKYIPVKIEKVFYSHPLSYNLYGLNICQRAIKEKKTVFIAEGEKSSLLSYGWYGNNSITVAACGDKINKFQINLLLEMGVTSVVICFDRMDEQIVSDSKYFNKLYDMCKKYSNYMHFSFVYDFEGILPYKAAPFDLGKETFEKLLNRRVIVS